jgi:hypothetical protein
MRNLIEFFKVFWGENYLKKFKSGTTRRWQEEWPVAIT